MVIQVNNSGFDTANTPSQMEGNEADVKPVEEGGLPIDENGRPTYKATDTREQSPSDRALKVAELRMSLASLKDETSGRSRAKKKSILYSLSILCK